MGFPAFRPGQEELVAAAVGGRDALGILPTGGGKSVCFQLPAFLLDGLVLVVSPLISLMEDQVNRAREAGLQADLLNSALGTREREAVLRRAAEGRTQLLLVAPERFQVRAFRALLPRLPVALLAVDEAHCISHWGHDFRPSYLRIGEVRSILDVPVLALTATATPRVRKEVARSLRLRDPVRVLGSFDRPNLSWEVRTAARHEDKVRVLTRLLRDRSGATIIYASTRRTVEAVRRVLASRGLPALSYHAGLPPERRTHVQNVFMSHPQPLVVATNAFGMGIDRSDVRTVVHYALSGSLEAYYQEAGRAGRDGEPAACIALHGPGDRRVHDRFLTLSYPSDALLNRVHRRLKLRLKGREAARVPLQELREALAGKGGEEELQGALRGLVRCGAIAVEGLENPGDGGGEEEPGSGPLITVLSPRPELGELGKLRAAARAQIDAVEAYAAGKGCRRGFILEYFGEVPPRGGCGRCDRCREPASPGAWIRRLHPRALFARAGGA